METFPTYISSNEALESADFYYTFKEKCYYLKRKCLPYYLFTLNIQFNFGPENDTICRKLGTKV